MEAIRQKFYYSGYLVFLCILIYIVMWLLSHVMHVVVILVASIFLAYLLFPVVRFFEDPIILTIPKEISFSFLKNKRTITLGKEEKKFTIKGKKYGRLPAILIVYSILAIFLGIALSFIIPRATHEFDKFVSTIPSLAEAGQKKINEITEWLKPKLPPEVADAIPRTLQNITVQIEHFALTAASHSFHYAHKVFSTALTIVLIPLFTCYILMDIEVFKRAVIALIPKEKKKEVTGLLTEIDMMMGRYIRGQILICIIIGISITITLSLMGIEYAVLIGIFSGMVEVIPYLGVVIGMIPAFLIALFTKGILWAIILVLVLEAVHWTEGHVIVPAIMGHSVGLPPLIVIVALLVGGETMGILGMFIAIPVASIIRVVFNYYLKIFEERQRIAEQLMEHHFESEKDIIS